jgi:hypothetical protein
MRLAEACTAEDIASAIRGLYGQNHLLVAQVYPRDGWTDGVFANLNLMPVLYKLLSIRYNDLGQNSAFIRHAAYRAGSILYLAAIRVQHGIDFSVDRHVQNLRNALDAMEELNIDCGVPILLWLLLIGGTRSITRQEHVWFVSKLARVIVLMDFRSWEQVMDHVRGVLWATGLSHAECEVFRGEVTTETLSSYHHIFV